MSGQLWKGVAIALLVAGMFAAAGAGLGWWLAARERDAARAELLLERSLSALYRSALLEQNRAVDLLAAQKEQALERGAQARQLAAANGKRYDLALAQAKDARAISCVDAMPAVNRILEAIR